MAPVTTFLRSDSRAETIARRIAALLCAAGIVAGRSAAGQQPRDAHASDSTMVAEVRTASRALDSALARGDTAALRQLYAPAYVHIDQYGTRSGRDERLAEFARGIRRVQTIGAIDSETFAVDGNVVVASARTAGQQTLNGESLRTGPRMSTRVWMRNADGQWQVILAQVTPIVPR